VSESTTEMTGVMIDPVTGEIIDQKELAGRLLTQAKEQGVSLVGPGGLLNQLTRNVLETALEAELTGHLGHEHGQTPIAANMRNGTRSKTVLTEIGPVEIEVPRDRDGSFEPVIVPKRKRRLDGIDQIVLSLSARGLTTGKNRRALRGGLRGQGLQRHHQPYHGEGCWRTPGMVGPTVGYGLSGALR
jgi:putative transposase